MRKILFSACILMLVYSCAKEADQPYQPNLPLVPANQFKPDTIEVWVNSNFRFPTGGLYKKRTFGDKSYENINPFNGEINRFKDTCLFHRKFIKPTELSGDFMLEAYASMWHNATSADSLKYLKDKKPIWISMKVAVGGAVVFEKTNQPNLVDNQFNPPIPGTYIGYEFVLKK